MPYKEILKQGPARKKPKPTYSVTNWHEYNKSLKNRGKISLYFPEGDLKSQFINENSYTAGVSGRSVLFKGAYIQLIFVFYRLYNLGLRQITGFMEDYFAARNLDIEVPSFGHLSDRFAELDPVIQQRCERLAKRLAKEGLRRHAHRRQHGHEIWLSCPCPSDTSPTTFKPNFSKIRHKTDHFHFGQTKFFNCRAV